MDLSTINHPFGGTSIYKNPEISQVSWKGIKIWSLQKLDFGLQGPQILDDLRLCLIFLAWTIYKSISLGMSNFGSYPTDSTSLSGTVLCQELIFNRSKSVLNRAKRFGVLHWEILNNHKNDSRNIRMIDKSYHDIESSYALYIYTCIHNYIIIHIICTILTRSIPSTN